MFNHEYTAFFDIRGGQPTISTYKDTLEITDEQNKHSLGLSFLGGWNGVHGADFKIRFYEQLAMTCMQLVKELKQTKKDAETRNESHKTTISSVESS